MAQLIDGYPPSDVERLRGTPDEDERSPFARDYDRLIYTEHFRRLQGKTQVATPGEADFFRSRLTHTIEVAQWARRLAEHLNRKAAHARQDAGRPPGEVLTDPKDLAGRPADQHMVDPDLCEAAAVLHDLGHAPWGHVGEAILDREVANAAEAPPPDGWELADHGGFNANAQSFRLATVGIVHDRGTPGLQLTRATLDAALKYPWTRGNRPSGKKGTFSVYPTEHADLAWVREGVPEPLRHEQTLEAQIMDWADDVVYAVHDIDDWHRTGYMPLARLAQNAYGARDELRSWIVAKWIKAEDIREDQREEVEETFNELFEGTEDAFEEFRNQMASGEPVWDPSSGAAADAIKGLRSVLFDEFLTGVSIVDRPDAPQDVSPRYRFMLHVEPRVRRRNEILKELLWHYVVDDPRVGTQQYGQGQSLKSLFAIHEQAARGGDQRLFPSQTQHALRVAAGNPQEQLRIVVDFITGMTDGFALRRLQRLQAGGQRLAEFT